MSQIILLITHSWIWIVSFYRNVFFNANSFLTSSFARLGLVRSIECYKMKCGWFRGLPHSVNQMVCAVFQACHSSGITLAMAIINSFVTCSWKQLQVCFYVPPAVFLVIHRSGKSPVCTQASYLDEEAFTVDNQIWVCGFLWHHARGNHKPKLKPDAHTDNDCPCGHRIPISRLQFAIGFLLASHRQYKVQYLF